MWICLTSAVSCYNYKQLKYIFVFPLSHEVLFFLFISNGYYDVLIVIIISLVMPCRQMTILLFTSVEPPSVLRKMW